jgi:hypothetical protein
MTETNQIKEIGIKKMNELTKNNKFKIIINDDNSGKDIIKEMSLIDFIFIIIEPQMKVIMETFNVMNPFDDFKLIDDSNNKINYTIKMLELFDVNSDKYKVLNLCNQSKIYLTNQYNKINEGTRKFSNDEHYILNNIRIERKIGDWYRQREEWSR